jgi:hypothetical protein
MRLSDPGEARLRGYLFVLRQTLRSFLPKDTVQDAVMLLGDVGQVEEVGERPRHGQRLVDRHLLEDARQRREVCVAPPACLF